MKRKITIIVIIIIGIVIAYFFISNNSKTALVSPSVTERGSTSDLQKNEEPETPAYNPPKEVKYDSSTNLKQELETVNPQIQDNDFEKLKELIKSL